MDGSSPAPPAGERVQRDDYTGPFDPDFRYEDLSHDALVRLLREWGRIVQLLDRAILAEVYMRYGAEAMEELAIEEWRGASPVYTRTIREAMGIEGDDVPAIFKSLQLDPGFVHQYMDVRYEVVDADHGFFELAHCGALMDVEPMGEDNVVRMCHHIEDPTFDATVMAINPRARCRPVHRPPRTPADRTPHCRWEVVIDRSIPDDELPEEAFITKITGRTQAATYQFGPVIPVKPRATTT
jgi:hypothetical protein